MEIHKPLQAATADLKGNQALPERRRITSNEKWYPADAPALR